MTKDITQWGGKTPWNKGRPYRGATSADVRTTKQRYRERRKADVAEALCLGVSLDFADTADNSMDQRGEFDHGGI